VKLGQMMAGRTDIFPEQLVAELGKLHEDAASFPAEVARKIVEEETGKAIGELYASFDDSPMAAASMAQVHCATLHDGTSVIVKVQRPGIEATVEGDISVLRRLARLAGTLMPSVRAFNLPDLVEELAETLRSELDFEREGRNARTCTRSSGWASRLPISSALRRYLHRGCFPRNSACTAGRRSVRTSRRRR
jgi:ubiquinone biosynthesis protein